MGLFNRNLNEEQFQRSQTLAIAHQTANHQEHEVLEPRTTEAWDHEGHCMYCRPTTAGRSAPSQDVLRNHSSVIR